jgi:hypothetical protein
MPGQARLDAPDTLYHVQDFEPGGEELVSLVNNVPLGQSRVKAYSRFCMEEKSFIARPSSLSLV